MAKFEEIKQAIETIRAINKDNKISLLHCTSSYPCPIGEVNLRAMLELKERFKDEFEPLDIGYSDHTEGITVPVMAATLGATVIEKHFTLDKNLPGPDHKASLNPKELKEMVKAIWDTRRALGSRIKQPSDIEKGVKKIIRKSIVARNDIPEGAKIAGDMLIIKRPGTGIEPKCLDQVIGKRAKKDIKKDTLIDSKDLS
jgi:N-acetylneuraminate synthase/N,N'-diacetyllegionaminate synthase